MIFLYFPLDRCTSRIEAAKMLCEPYRVKFHFRNEPKKSDGSIEHAWICHNFIKSRQNRDGRRMVHNYFLSISCIDGNKESVWLKHLR
jgi:hypothetical protein